MSMRDTSPEELAQQAYERGYHAGYSDGRHRAEECARAWQAFRDWCGRPAWQPIESAPSSKIILVHYLNALGNSRIVKARRVERWTEECSVEFEEGCGEYSEEHDAFYVTEGWWEQVDNWPEWCEIRIDEGEPTHWMPLPAPPARGEA